ncbi:pentatricopeptide repeat-containing protein At1g11290, chloroplastic-like [Malania oleifera]|uniref:pentatricopeptide repeat-containing protein At1g11290, chloroplastic-like n=1 Tax=Malania oleifera TaxID=397392 RepID=UPI0025ADB968|nr:pentatricopeptide repeat-containing protein At1g11290, chloroplastic-like [Malania oleifera]
MRKLGPKVDSFTIPSILKACAQIFWAKLGKEMHGFIAKNGLDCDVFVCNALIQMYGECGNMESARFVFDEMADRDAVSWSTMIWVYSRNGLFREALYIIKEMVFLQVKPNEAAMIGMVNLFAGLANAQTGKSLHAYVIRNTKTEKMGVLITTALIDMYAKCGNSASARSLFDGLPEKSIVSWTAMIAGYIRCSEIGEGAKLFGQMLEVNTRPNEIMMLSLIIECGFAGALELGKQLHACIMRNGFQMSLDLGTALVDMYGKCSEIRSARALFYGMKNGDVMIWSAMISACAKANCIDEAVNLFVCMRSAGLKLNEVTMISLLSLCREAGALDFGRWMHGYVEKQAVESDVILETALVDMYAKCGEINGAWKVFNEAKQRDICMWNAMMSGFAMHGCGEEALELFSEMEQQAVEPNDITFIGVIHACSHAGMVAEGKRHFEKMVHDFGLAPKMEHYGCMVDLLGRAGLLDEAHEMVRSMPMRPNHIVLGAFLASCELYKNSRLGEMAARQLLEMESPKCGYNVQMSNFYAATNRWNEVARVRKAMKDSGFLKEPGLSLIANHSDHEFMQRAFGSMALLG